MRSVLLPILLAVSLGAVPAAEAAAERKPQGPARLKAFASCAGLKSYAARHAVRDVGLGRGVMPPVVVAPAPQAGGDTERTTGGPAPVAAPTAGGPGTGFSQTNVQEQGVDEPDLVKTDGEHLFTIAGGAVRAVRLGAAPREVDALALADTLGSRHLLLRGDRLVVIASRFAAIGRPMPDTPTARPASLPVLPYGDPKTVLIEIDVSDPADLRLTRSVEVDGTFLDGRLTGDTARLVINAVPDALERRTPAAVRRAPVRAWLPRIVTTNRKGGRLVQRAVACDDVRRAPRFAGLNALTVLTLDLDRGITPVDTDALFTGADTVYASPTGLYLTTQRWTDRTETALHRFDASKAGETRYLASGIVEGSVLNSYSLSEHDGRLRVATTDHEANDFTGESRVTVLQQQGGVLARVGEVTGLGRGEQIYAVRFVGDTGYVVTFRRTDPLYTIDLSTPSQPRLAGELKILGYSAYLHPIGDDLLLGVGQDATEEGRTTGAQVSLFDVGDPANPVRLHAHDLGPGSSSEAEFDPHAFLWWPAARLAVLPVAEHSRADPFSGAVGLGVGRGGIAEVGRVEHDGRWPVRRSLVAGGRLYTVSDHGVRASALADLATLGAMSFGQGG